MAIKLINYNTNPPSGINKKKFVGITKALCKEIGEKLDILAAQKNHALLIVLQGMDASGKDGAIKKVFRYVNPSILKITGFKKPTEEEFAHDFLWRVHKVTPKKGEVSIFVRSHYEDILIQKVHHWIDDKKRKTRMEAINAFESLLELDNGTKVLKFFLHLSKSQQKIELNQRINKKEKHWKHNDGDWKERKYWDDYTSAYEFVLNNSKIPWYIVPVDKRWYRDFIIAKSILEQLNNLPLEYPKLESKIYGKS